MIEVVRGSLLDQNVVAIVNATNTTLRGGGGIDGAIHRAAGPRLLDELRRVAPAGCATSEVVVTPGFDSGFETILHTPGPVWRGGRNGEPAQLAACYRNCVEVAKRLGVRSLAFPSISTGAYGYPIEQAAPVAVSAVREALSSPGTLERVVFAMFGAVEYEAFRDALDRDSGS